MRNGSFLTTDCGRIALAIRLMLALSLWQGPLVWGHDHSTSAPSAEHVARFHGGDLASAQSEWHWHFSFPEGADPSSSPTDEPPPPSSWPRTLSANSSGLDVQVLTQLSLSVASCNALVLPVSAGSVSSLSLDRPRAMASPVSLQDLLCRMSC